MEVNILDLKAKKKAGSIDWIAGWQPKRISINRKKKQIYREIIQNPNDPYVEIFISSGQIEGGYECECEDKLKGHTSRATDQIFICSKSNFHHGFVKMQNMEHPSDCSILLHHYCLDQESIYLPNVQYKERPSYNRKNKVILHTELVPLISS